MLPDKIKCEEELENEGRFTVMEPVDNDSHVLIERSERRKDTEEDFDISDHDSSSSDDEEQSIKIDLDGGKSTK